MISLNISRENSRSPSNKKLRLDVAPSLVLLHPHSLVT